MWSEIAFHDIAGFVKKITVMRDAVGAHKILFASDNCAGTATAGEKSWLHRWVKIFKDLPDTAKQYDIQFTPEEISLILGENSRRLLNI